MGAQLDILFKDATFRAFKAVIPGFENKSIEVDTSDPARVRIAVNDDRVTDTMIRELVHGLNMFVLRNGDPQVTVNGKAIEIPMAQSALEERAHMDTQDRLAFTRMVSANKYSYDNTRDGVPHYS